jgi:hypothetical protein
MLRTQPGSSQCQALDANENAQRHTQIAEVGQACGIVGGGMVWHNPAIVQESAG